MNINYSNVISSINGYIMKITPEMAKEWLDRNIGNNRRPKPSGITRYATDMRNGNWGLNTDAIAFNENGELVNGQNRLHAVIKSGETIQAFVVFNFPLSKKDFLHMDNGMKRSFRDMIRTGYTDDDDVKIGGDIASAYICLKYHINGTPDMRIDFIQANRDIVRWAATLCRHTSFGASHGAKKGGAVRVPSVIAVALMDAYMCGEDEYILSAFVNAYLDNIFNGLDQKQIDYVLELRSIKRIAYANSDNLKTAKSYIKAFSRHLTKRYVSDNDYPAPKLKLKENNEEV